MPEELETLYDALTTMATNAGNLAWHIDREGRDAVSTITVGLDPDNWPALLAATLARIEKEHPEHAAHFRAAADSNYADATTAHENDTQQCLECDKRLGKLLDDAAEHLKQQP